jgi:GTPase
MSAPGGAPRREAIRPMDMHIEINDEVGQDILANEEIERLVERVLEGEGCPEPCEVSVSFVDADEIHRLNLEYRGIDKPTDVLSFNIDDPDELEEGETYMVGDLIVCPAIVASQAPEFGNDPADEMRLLLSHGCLHLMGYDHEDEAEAEEMEGLERTYLADFTGVPPEQINIGPTVDHAAEGTAARVAVADEDEAGEDDLDDEDFEDDEDWDDEDDDTVGFDNPDGLTGTALIDAFFAAQGGSVANGEEEQEDASRYMHPATYEGPFKSGFVSLVGRPNAGKSTLINAIVGDKLLITSPTAQTTRHRISAVYNEPNMQVVLVDTPGLHKPVDALGEELNISALNALKDVDVVAMVLDGSQPAGRGDEWVAQHVAESRAYKVLVVTKADIIEQDQAREQVMRMREFCPFDEAIVVSAQENFNVDGFLQVVAAHLPQGPRWFPVDMQTDMSTEVVVAEFIREKVLLNTRDEVPHSVGVTVDSSSFDEKKGISHINATVYVEREGQKGIIIGAGGKMIKRIGVQARRDLERLLGNQVMLKLNVKVKPGWRSDAAQIKRFGYGEGA